MILGNSGKTTEIYTEATEELDSVQGHCFSSAFFAVVLVVEGNFVVAYVEEAVVGDCGIVGVATEVFDDGIGAGSLKSGSE